MMNKKTRVGILWIALCSILITGYAQSSEKSQCISKDQLLEMVEFIPKSFPYSEKNNTYTIVGDADHALKVTVDGLRVTFFDSRDSDSGKWGSISNKAPKFGLEGDLNEVGCVVAGMNNYNTGKVDRSKPAVEFAQKKYNDFVKTTIHLLKKG